MPAAVLTCCSEQHGIVFPTAPEYGGAHNVDSGAEEAREHVSLAAGRGDGAQVGDQALGGGIHGGRVPGQAAAGQRRLPRALQAAVQVPAAQRISRFPARTPGRARLFDMAHLSLFGDPDFSEVPCHVPGCACLHIP